ncbi:MAG: DUF2807 domain-containing protein [Oscillospiraceae bacterium]|nr:DUF2807 domain-containing protein [Oscillospiraceae bacterium]
MIRKLTVVLAAMLLMAAMSGCVTVSFGEINTIQGRGDIVSKEFACDSFTKLILNIPGELHYTDRQSESLRIEIHENLTQYLDIKTIDGVLIVESSRKLSSAGKLPIIYLSAPYLDEMNLKGVADIKKFDNLNTDSFILNASGICSGTIRVHTKDLLINSEGVGSITLLGSAENVTIESSGVGSINAFGLESKNAVIEVSGMGNVEISCSERLDAVISGVGSIIYRGNPEVNSRRSGIGSITRDE